MPKFRSIDEMFKRSDRKLDNINQTLGNIGNNIISIEQMFKDAGRDVRNFDSWIKSMEDRERRLERFDKILYGVHQIVTETQSTILQDKANKQCEDDTAAPKTEDTVASTRGGEKDCVCC